MSKQAEKADSTAAFVAEVEDFLGRTGMAISSFGRQAAKGDSGFVIALREGRSPSLRTADRAREFMAEYDAAHPETAAKPHPGKGKHGKAKEQKRARA